MDQALRTGKRQSRMVSAAIIGLGLVILAAVLLLGGRRRESRAGNIVVGDDSTTVARLMGGPPPHRCAASSLAHLAEQFPAGTPRPTIDEEVERLRRGTTARWVYPRGQGCVPDDGATEIGLDGQGRVLWVVPTHDKRPLVSEGSPG